MKISLLCSYPVISEGLNLFLNDKYQNIKLYNNIDDLSNSLEDIEDSLVIFSLLHNNENNLNQIQYIKENYKNVKTLIVDFNEDKDLFFKLSHLNIDGYILGTFLKEDIAYAIHKISTGVKFYDRELLYKIVNPEPAATVASTNTINFNNTLTRRELEILSELSNGLSNHEISCNLNISENTVKKHISNIFMKINVKDRTQAIIYAYESGLIEKPSFGNSILI